LKFYPQKFGHTLKKIWKNAESRAFDVLVMIPEKNCLFARLISKKKLIKQVSLNPIFEPTMAGGRPKKLSRRHFWPPQLESKLSTTRSH
jgi:hypothetical protein